MISSKELARIAEQADLAGALTNWTLKEALRRSRLWTEADLDLTVAVNVSVGRARPARRSSASCAR